MNELIYNIFSLITILTIINGQFFGTDPVRFDVEKIENCNENSLWSWHLNIITLNNSYISVSFNGTLDRNLDNSITIVLEFYQWFANKEWKRIIKVVKKQACNFLRRIGGDLFVRVSKELGIENAKCPIPKNNYSLNSHEVNVQNTLFGKFLIGRFKGVLKAFTSKKESLIDGMGSFTTTKI